MTISSLLSSSWTVHSALPMHTGWGGGGQGSVGDLISVSYLKGVEMLRRLIGKTVSWECNKPKVTLVPDVKQKTLF